VPTQDFFDFIQRDPSLLAGIPTLTRVAAYGGGFPIKVDGELVGAIGVSGRLPFRTTSTAQKRPWRWYPERHAKDLYRIEPQSRLELIGHLDRRCCCRF